MKHTYILMFFTVIDGMLSFKNIEYPTERPLDTLVGFDDCINYLKNEFGQSIALLNWKKMVG